MATELTEQDMPAIDGVAGNGRTAGPSAAVRRHEPAGEAVAAAATSGLYAARPVLGESAPAAREELRLDVDGRYPQMTASGTLTASRVVGTHWIAKLTQAANDVYTGSIWYRDGNTALFPYTAVSIEAVRSAFPNQRRVTARFSGGSGAARTRDFAFASESYHPIELEYDAVEGTTAVTEFDTGTHPNRPASLPTERLGIDTVYRRAGFWATGTRGANVIPSAAGADALWSDMEMHDAMQVHWSRFGDRAAWTVWTLFAHQHEPVPSQGITPQSLGGIMFDDIGPNHRQGTAVFDGSFINTPPPGDPDGAAAVVRTKFWTAVHELGHTFNLAHSWQKSVGGSWIPLQDEPKALSFMNYPFRVPPGPAASFFAGFEYRFSDAELLFMRHAPERFVQQGNADWFDDHGFREAAVSPDPALDLEVRVHRQAGSQHFEFLEPVVVELKLSNRSTRPHLIADGLLDGGDGLTIVI